MELKEHLKQEKELLERAKKETEEKKLNKSIFGTNSTTYGFNGYNYNSYADGKYSKVAKAENWSKWSLPEDKDERLKAYQTRVTIKYSLYAGILLASIFILYRLLRNKRIK
jgi:hypothetical protein